MSGWLPLVAGTGSAVVGGFYLAFSAVVMPALRNRSEEVAIATMVAINEKAVRPPFMVLFFGTSAACAGVACAAALDPQLHSPLRLAGAVAYLAGWVSTIAVNVPLNNRLSQSAAGRADQQWNKYHRSWTRANNFRAALSIGGAIGLLMPTLA